MRVLKEEYDECKGGKNYGEREGYQHDDSDEEEEKKKTAESRERRRIDTQKKMSW